MNATPKKAGRYVPTDPPMLEQTPDLHLTQTLRLRLTLDLILSQTLGRIPNQTASPTRDEDTAMERGEDTVTATVKGGDTKSSKTERCTPSRPF